MKESSFIWSPACEKALKKLKKCFISTSVRCYFNSERKIVVKADAINLVVSSVLSQFDNKTILHPVANFSRKYLPMEINYEIYNKEPVVIVYAFKKWCTLLKASPHTIEVISDHRNLMYFTTN
jgi:hypothetical protein